MTMPPQVTYSLNLIDQTVQRVDFDKHHSSLVVRRKDGQSSLSLSLVDGALVSVTQRLEDGSLVRHQVPGRPRAGRAVGAIPSGRLTMGNR
jgi:hypothetical protein